MTKGYLHGFKKNGTGQTGFSSAAVDVSEVQLDRAKERIKDPRVTFQRENAAQLSFADKFFDGIFVV